ncbi:hypothetical protein AWV80_14575 [Cupriavidus sp. UYMU48A]|nr:hypothetical protein AWV80_14575 [Cupriavidus sp. UYMU48A]
MALPMLRQHARAGQGCVGFAHDALAQELWITPWIRVGQLVDSCAGHTVENLWSGARLSQLPGQA